MLKITFYQKKNTAFFSKGEKNLKSPILANMPISQTKSEKNPNKRSNKRPNQYENIKFHYFYPLLSKHIARYKKRYGGALKKQFILPDTKSDI
jgi:hypothetical protein